MNEHEKLKWIADEMGYEENEEIWWCKYNNEFQKADNTHGCIEVNVREIIFTPEFMDKLEKKYFNDSYGQDYFDIAMLFENLDDPVEYLYKLLK